MTGFVTKNISMGTGFAHFDRRNAGNLNSDSGMRDEKRKNYTLRTLHRALRDRDKHSEWEGWTVVGCGIENPHVGPSEAGIMINSRLTLSAASTLKLN